MRWAVMGNAMLAPLIRAFTVPFLILAACLGPAFLVALLLHRKKRAYKAHAMEPFTQLPLRPPGESLRLRIEGLNEENDSNLLGVMLSSVLGLTAVLTANSDKFRIVLLASIIFVTVATFWFGRKLLINAAKLWDLRLGFAGERAVAEELNQLLAVGFKVFHDVPFDRFNIDHVIVGAPGVFVVETKTFRKPARIKGPARAQVDAYGDLLEFPHCRNEEAVPQARLNAKTLGDWLSQATGERTIAKAIVTLPGWWVNRRQVHDVNVLNPEEIKRSFPTSPKYPLTRQRIEQISYQLGERCRLKPAL
jgi:hypothetical protein